MFVRQTELWEKSIFLEIFGHFVQLIQIKLRVSTLILIIWLQDNGPVSTSGPFQKTVPSSVLTKRIRGKSDLLGENVPLTETPLMVRF